MLEYIMSIILKLFHKENEKMLTIEQLNEIDLKTQEMYKQQIKMQDVAREYRKHLREDARDEAITERIVQAINNLEPIIIPTYLPKSNENNSYLLAWGDAHYGIEYEIKDLYGGVLNAYSPEIFKERMCTNNFSIIRTLCA